MNTRSTTRAALYARVSTVDQTCENQLAELRAYCAARGWTVTREYVDLRHTYASLLIQNGESLKYVQQQLGHSSIQMTADVYSHLIPGANRAAVDRLDEQPIRNPDATGEEEVTLKVGVGD